MGGDRLVVMEDMLYGIESYCQNAFLKDKAIRTPLYKKLKHLKELIRPLQIKEPHKFVHVGRELIGDVDTARGVYDMDVCGYVMLDTIYNAPIVYSFGVGGDVTFEYELARHGAEVYLYDHTVSGLPMEHDHFHFTQRGITGVYDEKMPELDTIEHFIEQNGHEGKELALKMDVEGAEWDFLLNTSKEILGNFTQIAFELHDIGDADKIDKITRALERLNETHQCVHLHATNCSHAVYWGDIMMSRANEVTYVRRKDYTFSDEAILPMPSAIDVPCSGERAERPVDY